MESFKKRSRSVLRLHRRSPFLSFLLSSIRACLFIWLSLYVFRKFECRLGIKDSEAKTSGIDGSRDTRDGCRGLRSCVDPREFLRDSLTEPRPFRLSGKSVELSVQVVGPRIT